MKLVKAIFGIFFTLVGGIGTLVSLALALGKNGIPTVHNLGVLVAYGLLLVLAAGILLIHSAEKE